MLRGRSPAVSAFISGNRLLDSLPLSDRADLEGDLTLVTLEARDNTHVAGSSIAFVDFPIDAVMSVVATLENGDAVEVGTVGNEGFVESDAALDSKLAQRTTFCQVRGSVRRMSIERFEARLAGSAAFARSMRGSVRGALFSAQQFAACNVKHSIQQRCARWLLMTHDRVGAARFVLTHEFLAIMLGVRRASVSEAAEALQALGAITYQRGAVEILDRAALHAAACECYEACKVASETAPL
jgi:CRP-like cAMP-binding protein